MNNILDFLPKLPVANAVDEFVKTLTSSFSALFNFFKDDGKTAMNFVADTLDLIPPVIVIIVVAIIAFFITGKKFGLAAFSVVGLWFVYNQDLWSHLTQTFTLVLVSSLLSIIIGVPLGILMAKSEIAKSIISPVLDFMQTMPAFVYLIPAVAFFGIGMVPGVFASLIFATPPTVRFTNLGIRQVSNELVEASEAFGSTGAQKLFKVELPMAQATIMAGINQTVMLALSMVVTASMIGAPGLGHDVLSALQRANAGAGFVAGLGIVILAIIIDRFTQSLNKDAKAD